MAGRCASMSAAEYHEYKPELFELVLDSLAAIAAQPIDAVVLEGAGSPG